MSKLGVASVIVLFWTTLPPVAADDAHGLFITPGAVDVVRRPGKGRASVEYYMREGYPAPGSLAFIQNSLETAGWRPATRAKRSRTESSSLESGWRDLPTDAARVPMHLWSARWLDARGNEVTYTLLYSSPLAEHGLQPTHVSVTAWYYSRKEAALVKEQFDREVERVMRLRKQAEAPPPPQPCPK